MEEEGRVEEEVTVKRAYLALRQMIREGHGRQRVILWFPEEGEMVSVMGDVVPISEFGEYIKREPRWASYMRLRARAE